MIELMATNSWNSDMGLGFMRGMSLQVSQQWAHALAYPLMPYIPRGDPDPGQNFKRLPCASFIYTKN